MVKMRSTQENLGVHPKVAQIVWRRDKDDKGDKGDKGDSTEKEKYICKNGMLPNLVEYKNRYRYFFLLSYR
jgi:hypothetical protein